MIRSFINWLLASPQFGNRWSGEAIELYEDDPQPLRKVFLVEADSVEAAMNADKIPRFYQEKKGEPILVRKACSPQLDGRWEVTCEFAPASVIHAR